MWVIEEYDTPENDVILLKYPEARWLSGRRWELWAQFECFSVWWGGDKKSLRLYIKQPWDPWGNKFSSGNLIMEEEIKT